MVNHFKGEGEVKADGKTWTLRFDMNVLANLERQTGKRAMQFLEDMDNGEAPIDTRRMICHAMLRKHHPEATIDDAGEILSEDMDGFMAVLQAALPDRRQDQPGNAEAKAGQAQ